MNKRLVIICIVVGAVLIVLSILLLAWNINLAIKSSMVGDTSLFNKSVKNLGIKNLTNNLTGRVLILLQNNYEIRPSGGFMGSFALAEFDSGVLKSFKIEDIYTPDGQIKGHVNPKKQIQQAFKTGEWRLRDSNWELDFTESADDILWFFDKGGEKNINMVIAINTGLLEKLIKIYEPIKVQDFSELQITSQNFYEVTQGYSEDDFFAGSTKKKLFITGFYSTLQSEILNSNITKKLKLVKVVWKELKRGQIYLFSNDEYWQNKFEKWNFAGQIKSDKNNLFGIFDTNLGANKANCCIKRDVVLTDFKNLKINYFNDSTKSKWGGNYVNYLRIIIPKDVSVDSLLVDNVKYENKYDFDLFKLPEIVDDHFYQIEQKEGYQIVGFWAVVPLSKSAYVEINFDKPLVSDNDLKVIKQPGIYGDYLF